MSYKPSGMILRSTHHFCLTDNFSNMNLETIWVKQKSSNPLKAAAVYFYLISLNVEFDFENCN